MIVRYVGRYAGVRVPDLDLWVERGQEINVPDDQAARLLEQPVNWEAVEDKKNKIPAPPAEEGEDG